ncbi:MAG: hypothetical protein KGH75_01425 [Rhodospirillales bacterium]|nr:hypothetical protein [Rhodospirillales bacterium]
MKFSAKSSDVSATLAKATRFVEKAKSIGIIATKKTVTLRLLDDSGAYFHSIIPAKISQPGTLSIGLDIFQSLIKSKTLELEYSVENNKLYVKALNSRMSGKDVPLLGEDVVLAEKSEKGISFGKYQSKILLMMSECAIPSFFQKILPQFIEATNTTTTVACADIMLSAIATLNTEKFTLPITSIPSQYARLMKDVIGEDCNISLKKDKLAIDTDLVHIELPMIQMDTIAPMKKILELDLNKATASFEIESNTLRNEIESILVVYEDKSPIQLKLKNSLMMNYKTNRGIFNSTVKVENVKNTCEVFLDVEMLRTIVSKCTGKIVIEIKKNVACFTTTPIKGMTIKYIVALVVPA